MMHNKKPSLPEVLKEYHEFLTLQKTLNLATVSPEGHPEVSYAPFIMDEQRRFYVYVSGLAAHTAHLKTHAKTGVMLIEDEHPVQQVFARKRASFECEPETIARSSEEWNQRMDQFSAQFGAIMELLKTLPDFILFRLTPLQASFVKGFGQAYKLHGENLNEIQPV